MRSESFDISVEDHRLRVRRLLAPAHPARAGESASPDARPTLVFLHDSLGSIALWRDFPERLASELGLDAIVYDRRGYGESSDFAPEPRTRTYLEGEAKSLGRVLETLGVSSAILFGHSDGGSIALIAAAQFPGVVCAVISEGAHVFVEEISLAGIRAAQETLRTTNLREKLARYHGDKVDAVASAWIDTWLSPNFRNWNMESFLPRIVCPVLVIQGEEDEYGTEAQVRAIVAGVAGSAEALIVPGVGHTPHRDAADVVLNATTGFLTRTGLPAAASAAE